MWQEHIRNVQKFPAVFWGTHFFGIILTKTLDFFNLFLFQQAWRIPHTTKAEESPLRTVLFLVLFIAWAQELRVGFSKEICLSSDIIQTSKCLDIISKSPWIWTEWKISFSVFRDKPVCNKELRLFFFFFPKMVLRWKLGKLAFHSSKTSPVFYSVIILIFIIIYYYLIYYCRYALCLKEYIYFGGQA